MHNLLFKQEITIDDKYRGEVDINTIVFARVYENDDELIVTIEDVEIDDIREDNDGYSILNKLNEHDIEWLKDLAADQYILIEGNVYETI